MHEMIDAPARGARYRLGSHELELGDRLGIGQPEDQVSTWSARWTGPQGIGTDVVARLYDVGGSSQARLQKRLQDEAEALRRIEAATAPCPITTPRLITRGRPGAGRWAVLVVSLVSGTPAAAAVPRSAMTAVERLRIVGAVAATVGHLHSIGVALGGLLERDVLITTAPDDTCRTIGLVDLVAPSERPPQSGAPIDDEQRERHDDDTVLARQTPIALDAADAAAVARFAVSLLTGSDFESLDPEVSETWAIDGTQPLVVAELWRTLWRFGSNPTEWFPDVDGLSSHLGIELVRLQPLVAAAVAPDPGRSALIRFERAKRAVLAADDDAVAEVLDALERVDDGPSDVQLARASVLAALAPGDPRAEQRAVVNVARLVARVARTGPETFRAADDLAQHSIATFLLDHRRRVEDALEGHVRPPEAAATAIGSLLDVLGPAAVDRPPGPPTTAPPEPVSKHERPALALVLALILGLVAVAAALVIVLA